MHSKLFWKKTSASNECGVNTDGIDNRPHSTLKWYTRTKLGSLLPFFRRTIVIIPYLSDVPIFSFPWAYWYSFHTGIEQSIDMHAVHHSEIFSGEEKVMRWTLLPKVFWSEARHAAPRRSSAPSGTPLPTRPRVISVTFTQSLDPFSIRLTRWCLSECSYTKYSE